MKNTAVFASSLALLAGACNGSRASAPASATKPVASEARSTAPPSIPPAQPSAPAAAVGSATTNTTARTRNFDDDAANAAPTGFSFARTGSGRQGRWVVRADTGAPSGANVLAQLDADDTDNRFPVAVANEPSLRDVRVSVRCKTVSGQVDQACGLLARYRDENNYFLTRANALENNIRLYTVRDGQRRQIANWRGTVTPNAWHEYRFDVRGDHLEVFWDSRKVIDHHDSTFTDAGRVGVWTKADSVTYFDDLAVSSLDGGGAP